MVRRLFPMQPSPFRLRMLVQNQFECEATELVGVTTPDQLSSAEQAAIEACRPLIILAGGFVWDLSTLTVPWLFVVDLAHLRPAHLLEADDVEPVWGTLHHVVLYKGMPPPLPLQQLRARSDELEYM